MNAFGKGVKQLEEVHFDFIEKELGITKERLLGLDEDRINELVYEPICDIEVEETPADDNQPDSDRCTIASDIVTILGNSLAEANGWIGESYLL